MVGRLFFYESPYIRAYGCTAGKKEGNVRVECATTGKIVDLGIKDANNMGAAMAPVSVKLTP